MPKTGKAPQFTQQLTVCLDAASAGALAIAAEIDRSSPSALSRRIITEALTARGLLQHPALAKYPELNPHKP